MALTENEKQKLIKKMDRKRDTLKNATKRYRTICQSVYRVVDAYDEAKDEMVNAELWGDWCKKNGYAFGHDASDFFA
jgi:hypothetical protein